MACANITTSKEIACLISRKNHLPMAKILRTKYLNKLGLDLLDVVELILEVEKRYQVFIPDEVPLFSIQDFVLFINQQKTLR